MSRASVLVADPDSEASELYASTLHLPDNQVIQAFDGRDALAKAFQSPVSLFIIETRLPFIDGFSLCEILRRDRTTHGVPILCVTADARADVLARVMAAGADGVIVKPFEPSFVLSEARRLIERAHNALSRAAQLSEANIAQRRRAAGTVQEAIAGQQRRKNSTHNRFATSHPPNEPPALHCPVCDRTLGYVSSQIGGVSDAFPEQWDYYACPGDGGRYVYRHRTRKLRAF